jgi:hypothetical protein
LIIGKNGAKLSFARKVRTSKRKEIPVRDLIALENLLERFIDSCNHENNKKLGVYAQAYFEGSKDAYKAVLDYVQSEIERQESEQAPSSDNAMDAQLMLWIEITNDYNTNL